VTGGGGGTEYTEDAAAAANPVGGAQILVRADTPAGIATTDGDNVAQRGSNFGAAYVTLLDGSGAVVDPIDASTHDSAIGTTGPVLMLEAADQDGSALPNAVSAEGDAVRAKASLSGVQYVMCVNEDGSAVGTLNVNSHAVTNAGTFAVQNTPSATGGCDIFRSLDIDESEEEIKATAGTLYGWWFANLATTTRFLKFYNATAANVTVGTTTPVLTFPMPGNSSDDVAANALGGVGIKFDTAMTVACTTGLADNDTGAPSANDVVINCFYK
jgi:hypothetical protein